MSRAESVSVSREYDNWEQRAWKRRRERTTQTARENREKQPDMLQCMRNDLVEHVSDGKKARSSWLWNEKKQRERWNKRAMTEDAEKNGGRNESTGKEDTTNTREMRLGKGRGDSWRHKGREIRESEDHEGKRDVGKTEWIETQWASDDREVVRRASRAKEETARVTRQHPEVNADKHSIGFTVAPEDTRMNA